MKNWHVAVIVAIVVGYALGVIFPSVGQTVKAKIGV